ncbi:VOC family protein [Nocardioides sp. BP30]|uniref:VOC family protein n=1 Tax=Nocardioides sp. BP30 TaxID=3036374 RepID=UPI0024692EDB|nr:VOC family protein [Nocardioides sp. BP30]WGL53419.1 VOC family protein [Nocardioides sp. BP30]
MTVAIRTITFDCADALALAAFWANLTDWHVFHDDDPEVLVAPHFPHAGTDLLFIPVPEGKSAKNRLHLDLAPTDMSRDEQVERALALGATLLADHREADGRGWVVLADPEGNEFCIVRSDAEREPEPRTFRIG